jgi:hypothetical protein
VPSKIKGEILGNLADKSFDTKVKAAAVPGQKSSVCVVL